MQELDLELIRKEIDKADSQLAEVLEKRLQLVMQVAAYKKSKGMPVKDKNREAQVIAKVASLLENKDYSLAVKNIMRGIIDQACVLEETALAEPSNSTFEVACFGPAGSFTHQALEEYFRGRKFNRHHYNTFEEVITSISDGAMDYAVLPIENSSTGGITEVYDLLRDEYDIQIEFGDIANILAYVSIGDRIQDIERLVGALADIKRLYSRDPSKMLNTEYIAPQVVVSPQEAFYAKDEPLPIRETAGRICSELVMCYPPGIPILAPGEVITKEIIEYIIYAKEKGCSMQGPEDPEVNNINVLV